MSSTPIDPHKEFAARRRDLLLLALVCAVFFAWHLGRLPLIDPDEPFYSLSAREMLDAHDWVVPRIFGHPQFEKPAMIYWLMMASMRAFGRTEAAERLPMALAATALVFATYAFGARQYGRRAGLAGAVVLATGVEFMVCARMVLTDTIFALFTSLACFAFWLGARDGARRRRWWIAAMLCSGLAVITKGPLGVLVPGIAATVAWVRRDAPRRIDAVTLAAGLALFLAVAVPWYVEMVRRFGREYLQAFFVHENWERIVRAEHRSNDRWYYYAAVLTLGSIPWLPSLAAAVARARADARRDPTSVYLWGWILGNLAFFMVVHSKLPTYLLFAFVPLALLAGRAIVDREGEAAAGRGVRHASRVAALVQVAGFAAAAFVPLLQPVRGELAATGAILTAGTVMLWRGRWTAWAATTSVASGALLVSLLTFAVPWIETMTSMRAPAATVVAAMRPGEPVACEPLLARGLTYYSGVTPVVLSRSPRPFFTPHPLSVIVGPEGLADFARGHGQTLCLVETSAWPRFAVGVPPGWTATRLLAGTKSLYRISPPGARSE